MIVDQSMLLKVEDLIVFTIYKLCNGATRRVCVCLLRRLPLANFGQRKVAVTHPCIFDCHFRIAEPEDCDGSLLSSAAEAMLGVFSGGV